jgi:hypothetical protein
MFSSKKQKSGTRLTVCALVVGAGHRMRIMWLALATITLAAAIGFSILALAIQFER